MKSLVKMALGVIIVNLAFVNVASADGAFYGRALTINSGAIQNAKITIARPIGCTGFDEYNNPVNCQIVTEVYTDHNGIYITPVLPSGNYIFLTSKKHLMFNYSFRVVENEDREINPIGNRINRTSFSGK